MAKICTENGCNNPVWSKGKCNWHKERKPLINKSDKILNKKPLNKVSNKRRGQLKEYSQLKLDYLVKNPVCEFPDCTRKSAIIHHKNHRENERLNDTNFWMALCGGEEVCHKYIHAHPKESYLNGWLIKG
jgi:hypothetical protein